MNYRNPTFTADGRIDCEIEHPQFGWIPFTADANDVEPLGQDIYAQAISVNPAPYVAPDPATPSAADIRAERNMLLTTSDWTQLPDAPVDQTAWAFYRQSLRDITDQEGFPTNIIWPEKPA